MALMRSDLRSALALMRTSCDRPFPLSPLVLATHIGGWLTSIPPRTSRWEAYTRSYVYPCLYNRVVDAQYVAAHHLAPLHSVRCCVFGPRRCSPSTLRAAPIDPLCASMPCFCCRNDPEHSGSACMATVRASSLPRTPPPLFYRPRHP